MTQPDPGICPLCAQPNSCAMARGERCEDCWCAKISIDRETLARVPEPAVNVACICADCASSKPEA